MAKRKTHRIDTAKGAVDAVQKVSKVIEPLEDLDERERFHFDAIVRTLPVDHWDDFRIIQAATLAKMNAHLKQLQIDIKEEGSVIRNDRGTPIANPKHSAMLQTINSINNIQRTLGTSASQRGESSTNNKAKKEVEKEARDFLAMGGDNLLAMPER